MKRRLTLGALFTALAGIAVFVLILSMAGGSQAGTTARGYAAADSPPPASRAATIATRHTAIGTLLVDAKGRTLYMFERDPGPDSACDGACASVWPPVTTGAAPVAGRGVDATQLRTFERPDTGTQVMYAGHPLYTYAGDAQPGDTKGQGVDEFGAEWYALTPRGDKLDSD